jgi:hypothetical protein
MNTLIGLVGFKQSGKSTAASYLETKYGFVRHNFKDALVAEIKKNFPLLLEEIATASGYQKPIGYENESHPRIVIDDLFQTKPPLMRALMQNYGTEVRRSDYNDYWTNQWYKTLPRENVVTDDVRFLNEAEEVKRYGGTIIRIIRTDIPTGGDHQSETEQLQIVADYTIEVGKGEQEKLYTKLDWLVGERMLQ